MCHMRKGFANSTSSNLNARVSKLTSPYPTRFPFLRPSRPGLSGTKPTWAKPSLTKKRCVFLACCKDLASIIMLSPVPVFPKHLDHSRRRIFSKLLLLSTVPLRYSRLTVSLPRTSCLLSPIRVLCLPGTNLINN